jgi:hypothetical protein
VADVAIVRFDLLCCRETGLSVSMLGMFFTCSFVIEMGSTFPAQSGWPIEIGEINIFRLESQVPVSTMR